jgi:hypothetical protein
MCAPFFVSEPSIIASSPEMDVIWSGGKPTQVLEKGYNVPQPHSFIIVAMQQPEICLLFEGAQYFVGVGDVPL